MEVVGEAIMNFVIGLIMGLLVGVAGTLWFIGKRMTSLARRGYINPGWRMWPEFGKRD
jgi:hypothetical protein